MLILVRHGESVANVAADNSDDALTDLTALGLKQAKALKPVLAKYFKIDAAFSSRAVRCMKTAKACTDVPVVALDDIYELSNGAIEGVKHSDWGKIPVIGKELAKIVKANENKSRLDMIFDKKTIANHKRFEELCAGESDYPARLARAVRLAKTYTDRGKNVIFITHGGIVNAIISKLFNMNVAAFGKVPNCSISVIDLKNKKLLLSRYTV
jgi:broad specificity phosphatase PhoE